MDRSYDDNELLSLSGIQHFAFCPRQWALIHIEQQWSENEHTAQGAHIHARCHDESIREKRGDVIIVRGLRVTSRALGLAGVCDVVEFHRSSAGATLFGEPGLYAPFPVEYKRGRRKRGHEDLVQVCAQAMALEEMFCCVIPKGALFYDSQKRREEVVLTRELREKTAELALEMHRCYSRGYTPKPRKTGNCRGCSLADICLPDIEKSIPVKTYMDRAIRGLQDETVAEHVVHNNA